MEKEEKKPIYKKWWFWLIVIIVIVAIGSGGTSKNTTANTSTNTAIESKTEKDNSKEKTKITVVDFSVMTKEEIQAWCDENKIKANFGNEYSDTIEKGLYSSQKPNAGETVYENETITIKYSLGREPTLGEKNALKTAKNYLSTMAFSYKGLIKQLEFEGYSNEEATYGADNCGADWNEQAAKCARNYLNTMSFSKSSLINQLEFEGFTSEQAKYGAEAVGY